MNAPKAIGRSDSDGNPVFKNAGIVAGMTIVSRILGLVRDRVLAGIFGLSEFSDAFFVAFRIPNLLRRIFAEGALRVSFLPVYTDQMTDGPQRARVFAARCAKLLLAATGIIIAAGMIFAPVIVTLFTPGWKNGQPDTWALTVTMTRIMFPYMGFIGLASLLGAIHNARGRFFLPAILPIVLNLAMIIGALLFVPMAGGSPVVMAFAVLAGGIIQVWLLKPGAVLGKEWPSLRRSWEDPATRKVLSLIGPAIPGLAVVQLATLTDTMMASMTGLAGKFAVSALYYANRLFQFPLGVVAIAMSTALLPALSLMASSHNEKNMRSELSNALKAVMFLTIPAAMALMLFGDDLTALLFEYGRFGPDDTAMVCHALRLYAFGLPFFAAIHILSSMFFAMKDTLTPVRVNMKTVGINAVLSFVLLIFMGYGGLALGTAASRVAGAWMLWRELSRRHVKMEFDMIYSLLRICVGSLVMALATLGLRRILFVPGTAATLGGRLAILSVLAVCGGIVYFAVMMRTPEWKLFSVMFKSKKS